MVVPAGQAPVQQRPIDLLDDPPLGLRGEALALVVQRSAAWSSRAVPAVLSWVEAGRTTTPTTRPRTSTASPRLRPDTLLIDVESRRAIGTPAAARTD